MRLVRIITHRFRSLFRCSKVEAELQRELGLHLDQLTGEYIASGMSESEARLSARRAFGSVDLTKEQCRDMRRVNLIEDMTNDLAFAFRLLRRSPGFMLAAVLTLALGIGANSAMFSVVHSLLIEPLPYPQADRLVTFSAKSAAGQNMALSYPDFLDFREQARAFESLATYQDYGFTVTGTGEAQRLPGRTVSAEFFSTLGVVPSLGRDFRDEDDRPGSPPVVVLSHQAWQRLFHLDPDIIGRDVTLNGRSFTVVGILPHTFQFYLPGDVFAPIGLGLRPSLRGQRRGIYAIGRLRSGATFLQAQSEVDTIARRLAQQYPENAGVGARLVSLAESFVGKTKPVVLTLLGAVSFVLLIACANVANLLLARAASRQREIAIRIALGAGKSRLLRQMLTESVLLALAGGGSGLLLGLSSLRVINSLLPENISRLKHVDVNGWVLGFTLLLSVATGAIFGLAPAWEAIRGSLGSMHDALKAGGRGGLDAPLTAEVYLPLAQNPVNFMTLVVHASGNPSNLSAAVRGELNAADRNLPLAELGTMEELHERGVATRQFPAILLGLFAAIALTLAAVGIYGVIAYSVSQRTSEIGIRMALGAKRADVVWLVIDQGMTPVWIGLLIGLCVSLALTRTLSSLLYGVTATDPVTFGAVALVLFGTGVLACALPARRASRIDPIVALRTD